jgi:hypothetical protein
VAAALIIVARAVAVGLGRTEQSLEEESGFRSR